MKPSFSQNEKQQRLARTRKIEDQPIQDQPAEEKRGRGRPALDPCGRRSRKISFDAPPALAARLSRATFQTGDSVAEALREAVAWYCDQAGVR